ncbi:MAG TPA: hypothetical protein VKP58_08125 [Candidatus Acidoferrum sp.]|nr:hypothetical protein [Candidatus Acidoferrum sp.]
MLQLVKISFPVPYLAIAFKAQKDPQGRDSFPIPGFGEIVRLTDAQAEAARRSLSTNLSLPMVFEIDFPGSGKILFMRKEQTSLVENLDDHQSNAASAR